MKRYKIIGPHVIKVPPNIKLETASGVMKDPVLRPLDEVLNDEFEKGWYLEMVMQGFPIFIPSRVQVPGGNGGINLQGACALLRRLRSRKDNIDLKK